MKVLGRYAGDEEPNPRGECEVCAEVSEQVGFFVGPVDVRVWRSKNVMDRGGVVLEILSDSAAGGFVPYAINTEKGVQIHLAGEDEGGTILQALAVAIVKALPHVGPGYAAEL